MAFKRGNKVNVGRKPWNTGKKRPKFSDKWRKNMSDAKKGKTPNFIVAGWNKGMKGVYKLSEETKRKIGDKAKRRPNANKGKKLPKEWRQRMSSSALGKLKTESHRKKIGRIGQLHWNWQGGKSSISKMIRLCFEYRQWRSDIFRKNDYACVLCGDKKGGNLEADHFPKMFSEILKECDIKTLEDAIVCEKLWDINNGRTLCRECHRKYGRKQ